MSESEEGVGVVVGCAEEFSRTSGNCVFVGGVEVEVESRSRWRGWC